MQSGKPFMKGFVCAFVSCRQTFHWTVAQSVLACEFLHRLGARIPFLLPAGRRQNSQPRTGRVTLGDNRRPSFPLRLGLERAYAQGRQSKVCGVILIVDLEILRCDTAQISLIAAAVNCRITVNRFAPKTGPGKANPITGTEDRS